MIDRSVVSTNGKRGKMLGTKVAWLARKKHGSPWLVGWGWGKWYEIIPKIKTNV